MLKHIALILALGLWSLIATAQVPVVEAGSNNTSRGGQTQAPAGNELVLTLYNQLEALQQEIQTLRGMVEEQSNQIRRLQTEQLNRYVDIDRRLSELSGTTVSVPPVGISGAGMTAPGPATGAMVTPPPANYPQNPGQNLPPDIRNNPESPDVSNSVDVGAQTADAQMNEQDLYRTALNQLLEQSQYEESVRLFQSYIDRFPQGRYLTNAYYWQGEALILVTRFNEARDVFMKLTSNYPEDPKTPGAMLKLGVVYRRMGNEALAQQTWREIATKYPENTTEIREAQDYLSQPQ